MGFSMTRFRISLSIVAALFGFASAGAAVAQENNFATYVSNITGIDTNACTQPTAPCRTMAAALAKTLPGGDIRCVGNHADFAVVITKPITIDCDTAATFLSSQNQASITINLDEATHPNGVVTLRNMKLIGFLGNGAIAPGTDGIRILGGGAAVHIENSTIQGFAEQGIDFAPSSTVDLFVRDTIISNNQGGGIVVAPSAAAGARVSLSNVRLDQTGAFGLSVSKASGVFAAVTIEDTNIEKNGIGLRASGASAFVLLSGSTVAHNTTGLQTLTGGKISSSGNNVIYLNNVDGTPTSTIALK